MSSSQFLAVCDQTERVSSQFREVSSSIALVCRLARYGMGLILSNPPAVSRQPVMGPVQDELCPRCLKQFAPSMGEPSHLSQLCSTSASCGPDTVHHHCLSYEGNHLFTIKDWDWLVPFPAFLQPLIGWWLNPQRLATSIPWSCPPDRSSWRRTPLKKGRAVKHRQEFRPMVPILTSSAHQHSGTTGPSTVPATLSRHAGHQSVFLHEQSDSGHVHKSTGVASVTGGPRDLRDPVQH